ncbi:MAG: C1 family peptidase [Holophagales bacterium]|jgi:bleomycin hydrolase|nr:C1 family peptidase [Holophagales bacterium]
MRPAAIALTLFSVVSLAAQTPPANAQNLPKRVFKDAKVIPHTPVKNQGSSGTCWCFATVSLIESEILRKGKGEYDLSEMHLVRATYPRSAKAYMRLHGAMDWGQGAQNTDALYAMSQVGLVPDTLYTGLLPGEKNHNHSELEKALGGFLSGIKSAKRLTTAWPKAVEGILDAYLGNLVTFSFIYGNRTWTPMSFMKEHLQINPSDYVSVGTFTLYAPYSRFRVETPDNWSQDSSFINVPFDDFASLLDSAIDKGFSYAIASDVSEPGFVMNKGCALLLDPDSKPEEEKEIAVVTPELRTAMFDDWRTTDDHSMHCVGTATDDSGNKFYLVKNSWGTENGPYKGFLYMSRNFMLAKTLYITVHKDALPADLKAKLGIK